MAEPRNFFSIIFILTAVLVFVHRSGFVSFFFFNLSWYDIALMEFLKVLAEEILA